MPAFIHSFSASSPIRSFVCFLSPLFCENCPEFPFSPFFSLPASDSFCLFMSPTSKTYLFTSLLTLLCKDLTCLCIHKPLPRRLDKLVSAPSSSECLLTNLGALKNEAAQNDTSFHLKAGAPQIEFLSLYSQKRIKDNTIIFHLELYNKQCHLSRKHL